MSWRERLTKASFRGFEFLTDSHEAQGGRRLVKHQYPNSDEHDVEDFGLNTTDPKLNAYFIGPDYDLEANGFLAKLAISGADWLQHPWLGQMWVRAENWTRTESNDKGGYCVISVNFMAGGRAPVTPAVDKVDLAFSRVHALGQAIVDDFTLQPMSNDTLTAFVADVQQHLEEVRKAISLATLPLTWAATAMNVINGVKNDVQTLLQLPQQYANAMLSFANVLGLGGDTLEDDVSSAARARAVARITSTATNPPSINASTLPATITATYKTNTANDATLRSQLLIVAALQLGIADYQDAGSRDAVLDKLLAAVDAQLPQMSDAVFQAAVDARATLIEALLDQDLDALAERNLVNAMPAVVLAYQMGNTEDVLIAQNNVQHPLFVQGRIYG